MILNNSNHPFGELTPQQWKPEARHKLAVKHLLEQAAAALFLPPGFGKTADTLAAFKILKAEGIARGALVVAPRRVARSTWPREILKWKDFNHLQFELLGGSGRDLALRRNADVYITSYEGMRWVSQNWSAMKTKVDTLVLDELSKLKHTRTGRFKTIQPLLPHFRRRWGLTGSPAAQSLMNLFGECYALDLGRSLGPYITHFRHQYFERSGYGGYSWVPKDGAKARIFKRLRPLALHLDEKDFLQLPQLIENIITVDLDEDEDARRVYDDIEDRLFSLLPDGTEVLVPNAGAALQKCQQISGGAMYVTDKVGERTWKRVHDLKLEALGDLVDELQGDPIMIAYQYDHELERMQEYLDLDPICYMGGGTTDKRAAMLEDAWNRGDIAILPVQPQSIAHGLNLQEGPGYQIAWFSDTWNYEHYDQLIRRIRRPGQKSKKVIVHHLVAQNTVDEAMIDSRSRKAKTQGQLLRALRSYRDKRRASQRRR